MSGIDWFVLIATLLIIVIYGIYRSRNQKNLKNYLLDSQSAKWWTVGLSVMATQASAITFLSTPGQAFDDGMRFVQFYFGLPIAMVIICITFIPLYNRLKVFTAYEFLEQRFDLKTRLLTAFLFLFQRGLAAGITIYAPAIVLSTVLDLPLNAMVWFIGVLVIIYTVSGGTRAVSITHKYQMLVIFTGLFIAFAIVLQSLPEEVDFGDALTVAGASGKLNLLDFSFDLNDRYTFWTGIIGGSFLALSYFGTDQSQVQRYLTGSSVKESRYGLLFNGIFKVPMQFFILLLGVMVYVFYQFNTSPVFFNTPAVNQVYETSYGDEFRGIESQLSILENEKQAVYSLLLDGETNTAEGDRLEELLNRERSLRQEAKEVIAAALPKAETNDRDYVFIYFILNNLPVGLIGILLAVFFSAAMSSTASELNALASTSLIDFYKRLSPKQLTDEGYVRMARIMTVAWGLVAIAFASIVSLFENLIQFVNVIGSLFYGTILGVFLVAFYFKKIGAKAVFLAAVISEVLVLVIYQLEVVAFLWLNLIGCVLVVLIASVIEKSIPVNQPK